MFNTHNFLVEGHPFQVDEEALSKSYLSEDKFPGFVKNQNLAQPLNFQVDHKLFRKWCLPYIRFGIYPNITKLKTHEWSHITCTAAKVGLNSLIKTIQSAYHIQEEKPLRGVQVEFTVLGTGTQSRIISFDNKTVSTDFGTEIKCPDPTCGREMFAGRPDDVLHHFQLPPHNASVTYLENKFQPNPNTTRGIIEFDCSH